MREGAVMETGRAGWRDWIDGSGGYFYRVSTNV